MKLLAILSLLFVSCGSFAPKYDDMVSRYALVFVEDGYGSAVLADSGYALVAYHVIADGKYIVVTRGGADSSVRRVAAQDDQVLVRVKSESEPLEYAEIDMGQTVYWIQPLMYFDSTGSRLKLFLNSGRVNKLDSVHFYVDEPFLPGSSGGGVFNREGELVGIIESCQGYNLQALYGRAASIEAFPSLLFKMKVREAP